MDLELSGKTALVLASSSGLGKAIAHELAKEGANVMLTSRTKETLEQAKSEIEKDAKGRVAYFVADLTNARSIKELAAATREAFGTISILVNNTGGPPGGSFETFTDTDWHKAFDLTLMSYIRTINEVLPDLKETQGRILNNASSSIKQPIDGLILSNVFRMGILGLSKSLSQELAGDGILVNTIGAGRIETDRLKELDSQRAKRQGKTTSEVTGSIEAGIPLGRYGQPAELAKMATFLVSGANTYVTGQQLLVDGGMTKAY
ncbi:3-oxoacyl-[acyl-carrier protein] reductase [Alkalibacterium putridalgicola]|uniref:3-oxoacyl-ACP reductase n=1 Tax=Alkalibacterium putridalgicola TaxID=426703 RepID=A0A1H7XHC6_9LACT|nr:SDR family oxidoreductase [Alkalibacterium putridalgicola]GEK90291.1 3-oxoacyl-ACP reductase [Alkalibacterium putridalgicola]SEM33206.1 3-oxoacyl-[acyl-carrier protein] reductase [Alkalibacterium putridalgicola]